MACVTPRRSWLVNGEWTLQEPLSPSLHQQREFACRNCAPCRESKASEWVTRLLQEGLCHPFSICATLTYSDDNLPPLGSLHRPHVAAFVKALRKLVADRGGPRFSFDACGEYSPAPVMRPHVHIALFGYMPPDAIPAAKSRAGNDEFSSAELSKAWRDKGRVTFQAWSAGAAKYCAGHQAHKLTGDLGHLVRQVFSLDGQLLGVRAPEFHAVSTRPGIGRRFFEAHGEQMLRTGFTVASMGGSKVNLPGYYMRRAKVDHPALYEVAAAERTAKAIEAQQRLADGGPSPESREVCAQARIDRSARKDGIF